VSEKVEHSMSAQEAAYDLKTRAKVAKKSPEAVEVEKGKTYYYCTCGHSKNQPFCDGSHKEINASTGSDFHPTPYTAEETTTKYFCCCKQTKNPPFCDGTHKSL
jgi:CDGSH-type Zn-finger protein